MATENRIDPRKNFVPRFLPWLLAASAFVIYWLTLNRWVSLFNVGYVAKISGWTWQPEVFNPISFLVTYPLRWLPAAAIPVALDIFTAACAALTLGLLARSVSILPQDRTEAQRKRERSDFSFLTIWSAWLPPVLAVLVCGLQLTFWEQATNCTGEMFDLLLFAFIVWSLLEYRLDEREWRLFLAALVYGAGMTDNWAMVGFFPIFIAAIIWSRGLNFFNVRFLTQMALFGLVGMLFYFLLPLLASASGKFQFSFWQILKINLGGQFEMVKLFFTRPDVRQTLGLLSLASLVPVFMLSIRWKSSFGDRSELGVKLTSFMFYVIHGIFFGLCLWVAFDPPFSARHQNLGIPFLTFYFLGALSIGYFSGYLLLVFGKEPTGKSQPQNPSPLQFLNLPILGGVWLLSVLAVAGLIHKNLPQIRATNDDTFKRYGSLVEENLPRGGGILLCDSEDQGRDNPVRLFLTEAALTRDGRVTDFVPLDTLSLQVPAYQRFLHERFPKRWPQLVSATQTNLLNPIGLISVLATLAQTNDLFYLHPSAGYYFEQFYAEPHGLVYKLKTLPNDTLLPPLPDKNLIAENESFWSKTEQQSFAPIVRAVTPIDPNAPQTFGEKLFAHLHVAPEPNQNAVIAGMLYSRNLDFWGVQLQRAGELEKAAARFDAAQKINPDNVVAQINLQFNQNLRAGRRVPVDLSTVTADQFGKYRSWSQVILANGPFDEPSFSFEDGIVLVQGGLVRQAVAPFTRVRELAPDNLPARFWLGQLYEISHLPDRAIEALRDPMEQPEKFSLAETNSTQLNILAATAYFQKNDIEHGTRLIELEISRHPTNDDILTTATQIYLARGLPANALAVIDRKLNYSPDDINWLYNKGYVAIQLQKYDVAIAALSRVLAVQTNNYDALFKRAGAYLQLGKLDEAGADYASLQQSFTNSVQAAYGLGEIAWRKHETNEAIRNYGIYLANAPANTAEATNIVERLKSLNR
jgi:tetratricopeptide (TPR) repeat protein